MKKIFSLVILLSLILVAYSQDSASLKQYYQQKSINRRGTGWIKLGLGTAMLAIGIASWGNSNDSGSGVTLINFGLGFLTIVGAGIAASSLISFKNAKSYSRMAMEMGFKNPKILIPQQVGTVLKTQPTFTLKVVL